MYSFILPFMYKGDRFPIFEKTVDRICSLIKGDERFEICIHESGPERWITKAWVDERKIRYLYSKWDEVFHRSWNLNVSARYLPTKKKLIFFDGDLLIDHTFIEEILKRNDASCWGWSNLHYLTQRATDHFMANDIIVNDFRFSRVPDVWNCAGGINIIDRKIFFDTAGWPEEFRGLWGGPDNVIIAKLMKLGYHNESLNTTIYHLNHDHKTHPSMETEEYNNQRSRRQKILDQYLAYSEQDWKDYIVRSQGFGDISLGKDLFKWGW